MNKAELLRQARVMARAPYAKVIRGEPEEGFLGEVPELPGCFTAGETETEALSNLTEAMTAWLMTALADGDPVPPPACNPPSGSSLVIPLSSALLDRLQELAHGENLTDGQYARVLLEKALGEI